MRTTTSQNVVPSLSSSCSSVVRTVRNPFFFPVVLVAIVGSVLYVSRSEHKVWMQDEQQDDDDVDGSAQEVWVHEQQQQVEEESVATNTNRCWDGEESEPFVEHPVDADKCSCPDPTQPVRRQESIWVEHHARMVAALDAAAGQDLDFVMLGDSITERFNGTRGLGKQLIPENHNVFTKYFDKSIGGQAALQGVAVGSAGDTTTELLWHLQNGLLHDETLNPRVWVVLIGTNDIGRFDCSTTTVYQGIVTVVEYLQQQRPHVPILIHALLPRSKSDYQLGEKFQKIQQVNNLVAREAKRKENWYYMDITELFLTTNGNGNKEINPKLMDDGLHPNTAGFDAWAPFLKQQIQRLLS